MGSIDDELATLGAADVAWIRAAYDIAEALAPGSEQGFGYGMPALVYRGKSLISVRRAKGHYGVYPFSAAVIAQLEAELSGTDHSKGAVRFPLGSPVPVDLLRALVAARRTQIDG